MPVQRTLFGKPVRLVMLPRRFQILFGIIGLFILSFVLVSHPATHDRVEKVYEKAKDHLPEVPDRVTHIWQPAHKPPVQANSTSGSSRWYNSWKWKNPFSSSITLDENRAVLPPLRERPPIYTYYEPSNKKDRDATAAEEQLVLIWRRAWWAQGFKPVVLGRAEAMNNPQYQTLQMATAMEEPLRKELFRWLAWGNMGTGILADYLALPMDIYEDNLLSFLRRGDYPQLSGLRTLDNAIFYGSTKAIDDAIKEVITASSKAQSDQNKPNSIWDALSSHTLSDDDATTGDGETRAHSIGHYTIKTIAANYPLIHTKISEKKNAEALRLLALLINGHLHSTFLSQHPSGITLLRPQPSLTTALLTPAIELARNLTQCPLTPLPKSCPPNRPQCTPCDSSNPLPIKFSPAYLNNTLTYTLSVVPHPYTLTSLLHRTTAITAKFLRTNEFPRDPWITAITAKLVAEKSSSAKRLVVLKQIIAGYLGDKKSSQAAEAQHSLWLTAEKESHEDLDWIFGFEIPRNEHKASGTEGEDDAEDTLADPELPTRPLRPAAPKALGPNGKEESKDEVERERELIQKARQVVYSESKELVRVRQVVEGWDMGDTEAWLFSRAWSARRRVERRKWEEEEGAFAGSEEKVKPKKGSSGGRWWGF